MSKDKLLFTRDHEWVLPENDLVVVGISDYAQHEMGDVVYVELPEPGRVVRRGDACGNIESVKAVSDVYSPLSGEVVEVNEALADNPELLNQDCYGAGWLFKLRVSAREELDGMMNSAAYEEYISGLSGE